LDLELTVTGVFLDFVNDVVDRILGTFESLPDEGVLKVKGELAPHSQNLILAKAEHTFRTMACRSWKDLGD